MSAKGGITEGKSHKEGGIPMVVKSTGQHVELEGGEGVINKRNMASDKKFEFQGKQMTTCEIASEINSANGNGVQIDCDNVTGKKYEYAKGGKILDEEQESSFKEWMDDGNVVEFEDGVYATQDAQYRNRLKGMDELRRYFRKEFLSDSYAKGGGVFKFPIAIERKINEINELLPKVKEADEIAGGYFGGTHYTYVQLTKPIEIKGKYVYIHSANGRYDMTFEKRYNVNDLENDISGRKGLQYDLSNILKAFKGVLKEKFKDGGWILYDEDSERKLGEYKTESEARKNLYEYEGNANIVEKSKWDNSNKYEGGGNIEWSKAEIGDSARVKSENKMGLIIKDYGRKFHLKFADDTEKTYDASELDFYRLDEDDEFELGGGVEENNYRISISQNDKYIGEYPNAIATLGEAKSIFVSLETQYKRPQYLISVYSRPTSSSGWQKINVDEWYAYAEKFEGGGDVRDFDWYQGFKKQQLKKGTEHEMEHIDTIREFKKKGVSDREVAKAIAQDHLDENENYYIELEKMEESSRKVAEAINHHEKNKTRRKNTKKFSLGGYTGSQGELIYIKMKEDVTTDLFSLDGKFYSETTFRKDAVILMHYISNNGYSTKLEMNNTGVYAMIPNVAFQVVGYDTSKFAMGGGVKAPFNSLSLSDNDKKILSLLRTLDENNATHQDRVFISNFRGDNVVNELSKQVISKIYSLLFEWHNIQNPIHNILIENVGAGNIASLLPTSILNQISIQFDQANPYYDVEKKICGIVNNSIDFHDFTSYDIEYLDAIVKVYGETNPKYDTLVKHLFATKKKAIVLGVAEFSSLKDLEDFKVTISINTGNFALNQMFLPESIKYFVVNEGITDKAKHTLIYGVTKY